MSLVPNHRYQVLTKQGFKDFDGISKVTSKLNYKFYLSNGESITVTSHHRFIVGKGKSGKYVRPAYKIFCGQKLSKGVTVKSIEVIDSPNSFYDFINVRDSHSYLIDSIDNHNCDEMAWVEEKKMKAFLDAAMPALSSGKDTSIVFVSTPNGFNHFYKYAKDAKAIGKTQIQDHKDKNKFVYLEYDYTCVPGRDQKWLDEKIDEEGILQATRNYLVKFMGSSATLIPTEKLMELEEKTRPPKDILDWIHPDFKQWEDPISSPNIVYTIGCDSAKISTTSKKNSDNLSIQVLKVDLLNRKITQVASLKTRDVHYTETAMLLDKVGRYYNNGWVMVENNSEGQAIADDLFNVYEYENVYSSSTRNDVFGFRTTQTTRSIGIGNLRKLIRNNILEIFDIDVVNELYTFVKNSRGRFEAATEEDHDDMIFALIAAIYWLQDNGEEIEISLYDFIDPNRELPDLTITENISNGLEEEDIAGMFFSTGGG